MISFEPLFEIYERYRKEHDSIPSGLSSLVNSIISTGNPHIDKINEVCNLLNTEPSKIMAKTDSMSELENTEEKSRYNKNDISLSPLFDLITKKGYTKYSFSKTTGISTSDIYNYASGKHRPSFPVMCKFAKVLEVPVSSLYTAK